MQAIINDPQNVVDDMLKGYLKCHKDLVGATYNPRVVKYVNAPMKGKVGIVTGGGSGHKPAFIGYIGKNMVDAVAVGEIFSSPAAVCFYDAFREVHSGEGVACLYGNYAGDNMNVKMAVEMAKEDGIIVKTVVANDDVASAPIREREKRRGVAGEVLMWKVGGAASAKGYCLDEVIRVSQKAIDNTRSMGIGVAPCSIPELGKPNFNIEKGRMEVGIGHHGEPGVEVCELASAENMASNMIKRVIDDMPYSQGEEAVVLVSGLGSTPVMELYIIYDSIEKILESKGIGIHRSYVGNYFTSLDMKGVSLTLMKLDEELKILIDAEAECMGLKQFAR